MRRLADIGAQAVVLACTEIGLLLQPDDTRLPLIDSMQVHALAAVELALTPLSSGEQNHHDRLGFDVDCGEPAPGLCKPAIDSPAVSILSVPPVIVCGMGTTFVIGVLALVTGIAIGVMIGQRVSARARDDLRTEFRALSAQAVTESSRQVFALADSRVHAAERVVAPVRESLERLNDQLGSLETQGASWQAQLKQQIESVHLSGAELRRETHALAEALRRPQVRGQWGEMQLKRSLELSGLTAHCTFEEQVSRRTDDGIMRPDVVVTMAGGRHIVIDSKVSLDAFLSATHADDPAARQEALARHAKQVRRHVDQLSAKAYWQQFSPAPEFVVMFLPAEALFSQALETDPGLLDYAAGKQVILATPTTLIAMLKTVGYAWTQEAVADNAREVHQLGRELYDRLGTVGGHLDVLGRSINSAVTSYNKAIGSLEKRVFVSARRMRDLKVSDTPLPGPQSVFEVTDPLTAPELVSDDPPVVIDGAPGRERWIRRSEGA